MRVVLGWIICWRQSPRLRTRHCWWQENLMNDEESEFESVKLGTTGNIILKGNLPPKDNGERRERRRSQRIVVRQWGRR